MGKKIYLKKIHYENIDKTIIKNNVNYICDLCYFKLKELGCRDCECDDSYYVEIEHD
jgi:hypothetical protein